MKFLPNSIAALFLLLINIFTALEVKPSENVPFALTDRLSSEINVDADAFGSSLGVEMILGLFQPEIYVCFYNRMACQNYCYLSLLSCFISRENN